MRNESRTGRHNKATAGARLLQVTSALLLIVFALAIYGFAIPKLEPASRQIERQKEEFALVFEGFNS